ncbi:hypothetical protein C4D60_Mb02t08390 [Musa balbisiana]|uniref:Uncharacterized protein n=1 Tax=Musa balbisiana TaxID=52838 RepID=A0A4S8I957_MUSBA|nr:hypothetical protein C4D60_Mb02t08390 [Musa balbisiana]
MSEEITRGGRLRQGGNQQREEVQVELLTDRSSVDGSEKGDLEGKWGMGFCRLRFVVRPSHCPMVVRWGMRKGYGEIGESKERRGGEGARFGCGV